MTTTGTNSDNNAPPSSVFRIRPSIILFGDSITQQGFGVDGEIGWASLLSAAYSRRADVLNRGFSGYNTQLAVDKLLPRVFTGPMATGAEKQNTTTTATSQEPDPLPPPSALFVTIFFGANDAALPGEKQHVPKNIYGQNLVRIVRHVQSTLGQDTPIVLLTPPPFDAPAWMAFRGLSAPGRSNDVAREYGQEVKRVANELNVSLVDTWQLLEGDSDRKSKYLSDGLHLSEDGSRKVYQGLMAALSEKYPQILPMEDGEGKRGSSGIPFEEDLWADALA